MSRPILEDFGKASDNRIYFVDPTTRRVVRIVE